MNCQQCRPQLCAAEYSAAVLDHLVACPDCRSVAEELRLEEACQQLRVSVPMPAADFRQKVISEALLYQRQPQPEPKRWLLPSASAFAALLLMAVAVIFNSQQAADITWQQNVALVFNAPADIESATIEIRPGKGVLLTGYDEPVIRWQTPLQQGSNRLTLPVSVHSVSNGGLTVTLSYGQSHKEIQVNLDHPAADATMPARAI